MEAEQWVDLIGISIDSIHRINYVEDVVLVTFQLINFFILPDPFKLFSSINRDVASS